MVSDIISPGKFRISHFIFYYVKMEHFLVLSVNVVQSESDRTISTKIRHELLSMFQFLLCFPTKVTEMLVKCTKVKTWMQIA